MISSILDVFANYLGDIFMNIFLGGNNMFSNSNCASIPLVANIDGNGNNGGWADGGWLWIIVVFALLFGWGNGGFGGFGGNNGGGYVATAATQADIQRGFDNSAVISKLDGISNGLCDGFYAMNNSMLTGFNGINTNIMQTGYGIQQAINADTVANMQNTNAIQSSLNNMSAQNASCCCEIQRQIERGFADTNYNLATQACDIKHAINDSTRQVLDFLTTDKIATLQAENQNLKLKASQAEQNAYLLNELKPCPSPAYVVQPPTQVTFPVNTCGQFSGYGYNGGCGCGCA